jgi:flagellar biosynthetic protein FliR
MIFRPDTAWVTLVLLVSLRIAPLFIVAPVFGTVPAPVLFRAALIVALSAAIVTASGLTLSQAPATLPELASQAASELVVGAALGFGLAAAFAAFLFAGRILDLQFGFGIATLIDPTTRTNAPLLGVALNLLAITLFFVADGHHILIRALAFSLDQFPPGRPASALNFAAVVPQFGVVFTLGLVIAAPAMFVVMLLDVGFAVASRTMPQMNVFIVAIPFKIVLGLLVLALSMRHLGAAAQKAFESVFQYWSTLLPS